MSATYCSQSGYVGSLRSGLKKLEEIRIRTKLRKNATRKMKKIKQIAKPTSISALSFQAVPQKPS